MLRPLRYRGLWLALGILAVIIMVVSSLAPGITGPSYPGFDKLEHIAGYVILTTWFAALLERRAYGLLAVALLLLGIGVEFAQDGMSLGRMGDWRDIVANSVGIAIGLWLAARRRESWLAWVEQWLPVS